MVWISAGPGCNRLLLLCFVLPCAFLFCIASSMPSWIDFCRFWVPTWLQNRPKIALQIDVFWIGFWTLKPTPSAAPQPGKFRPGGSRIVLATLLFVLVPLGSVLGASQTPPDRSQTPPRPLPTSPRSILDRFLINFRPSRASKNKQNRWRVVHF